MQKANIILGKLVLEKICGLKRKPMSWQRIES